LILKSLEAAASSPFSGHGSPTCASHSRRKASKPSWAVLDAVTATEIVFARPAADPLVIAAISSAWHAGSVKVALRYATPRTARHNVTHVRRTDEKRAADPND
jgi:hypothetical protein